MHDITQLLGHTDIYLLDQIMKGRYTTTDTILDAGAGGGRNLHWFVREGCTVYATDRSPEALEALRDNYPGLPLAHISLAPVEQLPFPDAFFDHIICSAVLHFAENTDHFEKMFAEMVRVLRPGGSLFIRATTDAGLPVAPQALGQGRFFLPDGTERFLITRAHLDQLLQRHELELLEPFKTVLVEDLRSMAVIVLGKQKKIGNTPYGMFPA